MDRFDIIVNKGLAYVWLALFIGCLAGVIIKGAYWHLFTAGISWIMYRCCSESAKDAEHDAETID